MSAGMAPIGPEDFLVKTNIDTRPNFVDFDGSGCYTESTSAPLSGGNLYLDLYPQAFDTPNSTATPNEWGESPEADANPKSGLQKSLLVQHGKIGSDVKEGERMYWGGLFVMMPAYVCLGCLVGLQHEVKTKLGIEDGDSAASHNFSAAVSLYYMFNLTLRFGHNVFFCFLTSRGRVFLAMTLLACAILIIVIPIMTLNFQNLGWVVLAYTLGGVGIGTFETNLLACLTPLGHKTKTVAITGIPLGLAMILIVGFFVMGPPFYVPATAIYVTSACGLVGGMFAMVFCVPATVPESYDFGFQGTNILSQTSTSQTGLKKLLSDMRQFRLWFPKVWHVPCASTVAMFSVSCFSPGVLLYIFNGNTVALTNDWVIATETFMSINMIFATLGSVSGRLLSFKASFVHPLFYTSFSIVGILLVISKNSLAALFSGFFVMFADGMVYGAVSRRIDVIVPREFHLIALSYWLFVGDVGSVVGSNLISYISDWVGNCAKF
eukprot:TRINITY_DN11376_c0_g1_i1.p1 TRINITY_DN11376_c0_g1~~TRINITY_DN11376_c0_g1_i1.p1  ORF type:complete len:492 (+),score=55.20 TRINITY_DN11376_c0_g1_i1:178-1653(+)